MSASYRKGSDESHRPAVNCGKTIGPWRDSRAVEASSQCCYSGVSVSKHENRLGSSIQSQRFGDQMRLSAPSRRCDRAALDGPEIEIAS